MNKLESNFRMSRFVAKNAIINTAAANVAGGVNGMCLVGEGDGGMKGK
jgi:hypothetical protein